MAKPISNTDLRAKSDDELSEFIATTTKTLVETRFSNYTNQLGDTSTIGKVRRELARALTEKKQRANRTAAKA